MGEVAEQMVWVLTENGHITAKPVVRVGPHETAFMTFLEAEAWVEQLQAQACDHAIDAGEFSGDFWYDEPDRVVYVPREVTVGDKVYLSIDVRRVSTVPPGVIYAESYLDAEISWKRHKMELERDRQAASYADHVEQQANACPQCERPLVEGKCADCGYEARDEDDYSGCARWA